MSRATSIAGKRRRGFAVFTAAPFATAGTSLYATVGSVVQYRALRTIPRSPARGLPAITKTSRVAFAADPAVSIDYTLPVGLAGSDVVFDVRRCADNVECLVDNADSVAVTLDGSLDDVTAILGAATLLAPEIRAGGVVRLRFRYHAADDGLPPATFTWSRTAGPTSPADSMVSFASGQAVYEVDTAALSDASPYTYKLTATNGARSVDLLTGVVFTADASGPPAPASASAEDW